jgi:hypothetical protein
MHRGHASGFAVNTVIFRDSLVNLFEFYVTSPEVCVPGGVSPQSTGQLQALSVVVSTVSLPPVMRCLTLILEHHLDFDL